ncbi:MAG: methylated-DNA--[protein]-cysteine S-methyltransferase [Burkholderiales bacterium]|nr:methylated-DNA--[protein]-cysteine S-methyltransferase [Burkholderiales bacterium]
MRYAAKIEAPFGFLGIRTEGACLAGIEFLPSREEPLAPSDAFAEKVCLQLAAYLADPDFDFDLPLQLHGTEFRKMVWGKIAKIPRGKTRLYGEIAQELSSAPRAVGQACGANPLPIVIPCHRVVAKTGLGGFMHHGEGDPLLIKKWLLAHESD